MAREIARRFNADIVQIKSEQYSLDYIGWLYANYDSRNNEESEIEPNVVDMKQYSHIFLGSPVWMFRPAPPLWTFVKSNTFNGKKVILFNTFNSRFKDDEFAVFKQKIQGRGGAVIDHIYVRRGRVYNQMSNVELFTEIKNLLDKKLLNYY